MERITRENLMEITARMATRHYEILEMQEQWNERNGYPLSAIQKAVGNSEVLANTHEFIQPLLSNGELFFVEKAAFGDRHGGIALGVKAEKYKRIEDFIERTKRHLDDGSSCYLYSIEWRPPYEVMGERTEGWFMTRMAVYNRKNEGKQ